jgi:hypothetical protein
VDSSTVVESASNGKLIGGSGGMGGRGGSQKASWSFARMMNELMVSTPTLTNP